MITGHWQESGHQNIFEMFVANGEAGFWIRRTTWGATCARVIRVGAMTKLGPYFGNPFVLMDVYSLEGTLKEGLAQVPVLGTYKTWRRIAPPHGLSAAIYGRSPIPRLTPRWKNWIESVIRRRAENCPSRVHESPGRFRSRCEIRSFLCSLIVPDLRP